MTLVIKKDFYKTLTEHHKVLKHYKNLVFNPNNTLVYSATENDTNDISTPISVKLFPNYLTPLFLTSYNSKVKVVPQKKINGYAIVLNKNQELNEFLNNQYSKSFRANIKRLTNRFETCFTATYKMYYGNISEEDYQYYMSALQVMLVNRFNQRNDKNDILTRWDFYLKTTRQLINNNDASLFVIYSNNVPVHICINHHYNNIFYVSIPSYNIDYAKFALGNISLFKLLEWSINNGYDMLDMAYGDLEYKRRWCTLIYHFDHHIIYNKENLKSQLLAFLEIGIIKTKNVLKKYNIDTLVKKIKAFNLKKSTTNLEPTFNVTENPTIDYTQLIEIDYNNSNNRFLKKHVLDFLYRHKEHVDNIKVYKNTINNHITIVGKSNSELLSISDAS
ncbi:GNAT family N-acetyltransferase [Mariniflexile sp. HMF6888]|uniref:GNAT family N-acetyltransferase n=1 Tax=Mariniflexile sp. HMF6888 TaxID=3373086 RepID=UPI0037BC4B27